MKFLQVARHICQGLQVHVAAKESTTQRTHQDGAEVIGPSKPGQGCKVGQHLTLL